MKKPKTTSQNPYMQMPYGGYGYGYPSYQQPGQVQGAYQAPPLTPPGGMGMPPAPAPGGMLALEESYIENILRLNKGKLATVYMTFEGGNQKVFKGIVEAAGRDHIVLSDPQTGKRYILLMVYLDYITFDEEIEYTYPFNSMGQPPLSSYSPR